MAEEIKRGYCRTCERYGPVRRNKINHILHLILSIITMGAWLFVWIALSLLNMGGWRCPQCGGDNIDQVGELFTLKGWLLFIFLVGVVSVVNPEIMGASWGLIIILSVPVFIIGAHVQKKRQEAGAKRQVHTGTSEESEHQRTVEDQTARNEPTRRPHHAPRGGVVATFDPPVEVTFDYQGDADDEAYSRSVEVRQLLRRGERLYLYGWCDLRDDERMFRTDRIQGGALVMATGESLGIQILNEPTRLQMALMAANVL